MKVITKYPVIIDNVDLSKMESFIGEDGNEYFCSLDGEHFYNAKGEKFLAGVKKVGGGLVKGAKAVGRIVKKASVLVVKASKNVAKGVKKVGGKAKSGANKLIHHKKQSGSTKEGFLKNLGSKLKNKDSNSTQNTNTPIGNDVFSLPLKKISKVDASSAMPKDIVRINGENYSTQGIPADKEIVVATDEQTGQEIPTVQYNPEDVVGVTGADGNIEYYKKDDVKEDKGMSKGLKIGLIVGGSVLALTIIGLVIYKSRQSKKNN